MLTYIIYIWYIFGKENSNGMSSDSEPEEHNYHHSEMMSGEDNDLDIAIRNSMNDRLNTGGMDSNANSYEQALANSLMDMNMNQIHNDSFTVDVLPGIFLEHGKINKVYGDGIILPSRLAAVIAELEISDIIVLRFVIGDYELTTRECYGYIADYVDGDYAYVPGNILGDSFMPGQMVDFEIVNRRMTVDGNCLKPATKVVLKFDCDMTGIDFRELLEPWIGNVYRCLVAGNILAIEDGLGVVYNAEICNVYNDDGECDIGIAYNTDLEIELVLPAVKKEPVDVKVSASDEVEEEPERLSIAELRAQRLAYFDRK